MDSICLDDSDDTDPDWDYIEPASYNAPRTPSDHQEPQIAAQPQFGHDASDGSDDEYGGQDQKPRRKKGGYDSRIEQILYENPELPILIVDAGKSIESGGKYIVYTIRTGVCSFLRSIFSVLTWHRISRFAEDIPNLLLSERLWPDYILRSSFLRFQKSILWPTTRRTQQKRSKISKSSICGNVCWLYS